MSADREKELIGLFTPKYLPAIDGKNGKNGPVLERTESAPPIVQPSSRESKDVIASSLPRTESDTAMMSSPKLKRPMQMYLVQRTSSSGSSADGKLVSAMKSPTHALQRPRREGNRVQLIVGDSKVLPSDEVPPALDHRSTHSHSKTRAPATEQEYAPNEGDAHTIEPDIQLSMPDVERIEDKEGPPADHQIQRIDMQPSAKPERPVTLNSNVIATDGDDSQRSPPKPTIDPDGDLFDLEEEEAGLPLPHEHDDAESAMESEDELITGGIERDDENAVHISPSDLINDEKVNYEYDPEAGLIPEPAVLETELVDEENTAVHLEFGPGSAGASQQPIKPGFRRPSVITDPVFRGNNYETVETRAVEDDVYGSSFARPASKGSFTAGSLGGSFMAKHAEEMMKLRGAKREQEVRT